jgi:hypothetical protein
MMAIPAPTDDGDQSEPAGLPEQPPAEKSNVIGRRGRKAGLSETSNDYPRVVAVLSDGKTRVIVCYAGIQWILQRRQGEQWHSRSFCCTKEALIRCCGGGTPELDALPDRIDGPVVPTNMQKAAE